MTETSEERTLQLRTARSGRESLAPALLTLQRVPEPTPELERALEHVAAASGSLFELEVEGAEPLSSLRLTLENLSAAVELLQSARPGEPLPENALEAIARTMAVLYPVTRGDRRRRRPVQLDLPPSGDAIEVTSPVVERAASTDDRRDADRVDLIVDLGLLSDSHFYAGLSRDLSRGGLFIATYAPEPTGKQLFLSFVLPGGHHVQTQGVVRWVRDVGPDSAPGMGVAFIDLEAADRVAIEEYCALRDPIYHLSADDDI
ncbi:MAG: TIGR02266 family protein [Polyangiaceae bacterium]|nr:TIGR02266 family protein [Polyangiaceae bacterium]